MNELWVYVGIPLGFLVGCILAYTEAKDNEISTSALISGCVLVFFSVAVLWPFVLMAAIIASPFAAIVLLTRRKNK